jgi:hypothetical protein
MEEDGYVSVKRLLSSIFLISMVLEEGILISRAPRILWSRLEASVLDTPTWFESRCLRLRSINLAVTCKLSSFSIRFLQTGLWKDRDVVHTGISFPCLRPKSYFLSFFFAPAFMHQESLIERYIYNLGKLSRKKIGKYKRGGRIEYGEQVAG